MAQLIDDLLGFSRSSRQEMRLETVDMARLVRAVVDDAVALEPGRAIDVELGALPEVSCDANLIRQVWINLVGNAVKYTRRRERARIAIGGAVENGEVVYRIEDNGVGFDMAYAARLFGVFQRLHRADEFEGTGVGLALVQRIVRRHGGRVWADARVDGGATFRFALPRAD
jgi:light-regulated signal transduction histidine kinase (bacteriophytochrome)